LIKIIIK